MSAYQTFALCIECWEFHYGISDANGVYSRDSGSSNHWDHAVHVFGPPSDYNSSLEQPIRQVLLDLHAGKPISDARMGMFSLVCALTAIQPTNGRVPFAADGKEVPLGAVELVARDKKRGGPKPGEPATQEPAPIEQTAVLF